MDWCAATRPSKLYFLWRYKIGTAKQQLIDDLENLINTIDQFIQKQLESDEGQQLISRDTLMEFTLMSNKHIPPEMCSDLKLMERIHEAEVFYDNLKINLIRHDRAE